MQKSNIILGFVVILLIVQTGIILYQYESITSLEKNIDYLNGAMQSLAQEVGLTKSELEVKINENYAKQQEKITGLAFDVIKTQEDLEEQSVKLSEQLREIKNSVSSDFSGVIDDTINAVVSIKTDVSQGSGFIINREGYVVTNAHVLAGASEVEVQPYKQSAKNAELVGYNTEMDIALLKINGNYNFLEFTGSDSVNVGEKVIAMGNPYGLSFSVTEGIISSLNRKGPNGREVYIQTDVPLNPGNSGGPLVNKQGKAVGINNFKIGGAESLGFALESDSVIETANNIAKENLGKEII